MKRIMFICHGNICRSPMGECILKDMVKARGIADEFVIDSCATSTEEIGNPIYPPARRELERHGVTLYPHFAVQLKKSDYDRYDLFLCMDGMNVRNTLRIFGGDPQNKVRRLLKDRDVSDPWYTDRFDVAYADIVEGCEALLNEIYGKEI